MKLLNPTDDELNAAFAENVAKLEKKPGNGEWHVWYDQSGAVIGYDERLNFTRSADAVLPWLEKWVKQNGWAANITMLCDGKGVDVVLMGDHANADSFPRAAVIALLRAHGVEVEFTS